MATSTVDSEEHWVGAAVYAAMGAYSEDPDEVDDDGNITTSTKQTVGFGPPSP